MLITIPGVFSQQEVLRFRSILDRISWNDGLETAGEQSAIVKKNQQLSPTGDEAVRLGQSIVQRLMKNELFLSAALPSRILPPMFNKYESGESFGVHVDNAIRVNPLTQEPLRTDLSMTLFFSMADEYDGGELIIEDHSGAQQVKLDAGDMILYPSTSLHRVVPVTRGARVSSFFWLQSMVRSNEQRAILFDLDQTVQALGLKHGTGNDEVVRLTGIYHNLIRQWASL